jgi:tetratricopeptide (TPR) repeat protein
LNASANELRVRLERFSRFLKQDPANSSLAAEVADLQQRIGEFTNAEATLTDALARHPSDVTLRSRLASVYISSNNVDRAHGLLQELLNEGQTAPALHYNLAYALLLAGKPEEALVHAEPLAANANVPQAPVLLARIYHHLGELDHAIDHIDRYLTAHPDDADALGVGAIIFLDTGNFPRARELADRATRLAPNDLGGLVTLGTLALEQQDTGTARTHFASAIERSPKSGRAWSGMGLTAMLGLDLDEAIEALHRAADYMPTHLGTWQALAWCQILKRDLDNAEKSLNAALEQDRTFSETHGALAVIHVMRGNIDLAEAAVKRALRLEPTCFSGRFAQSLLLSRSDPQQAQRIVRDILQSSIVPGGERLQDMLRRALPKVRPRGKHH